MRNNTSYARPRSGLVEAGEAWQAFFMRAHHFTSILTKGVLGKVMKLQLHKFSEPDMESPKSLRCEIVAL